MMGRNSSGWWPHCRRVACCCPGLAAAQTIYTNFADYTGAGHWAPAGQGSGYKARARCYNVAEPTLIYRISFILSFLSPESNGHSQSNSIPCHGFKLNIDHLFMLTRHLIATHLDYVILVQTIERLCKVGQLVFSGHDGAEGVAGDALPADGEEDGEAGPRLGQLREVGGDGGAEQHAAVTRDGHILVKQVGAGTRIYAAGRLLALVVTEHLLP